MSNTAPNIEQLSPLQRSVLVIKEMKEKLEQIENKQTEPIAIVGMGCRFPGGANSPESFWELLRDGVDVIGEVPRQRWDINTYYDPNPETANKMYSKYGGFLDEIDKFDAEFFGLTPREATSLDPQQRLLLEVSWETLENAGIAPDKLNESKTGVFVGISLNEYAQQAALGGTDIDVYTATGNALSVAAGRLSYFLGLQGAALAVDTACSSSLVAIHLACQSLRTGECRQALAGGVYLMVSPQTTIAMSKLRALSVDGRCKTFDAAADGYGRGEGCGIVALKRMSDAIADGDRILALIRGSAVNQDGRSSGLTVPNAQAQQAVIREALVNAKVQPAQIGYVEAHGTGTSLGDPIEVKSLGKVLGKNRSPEQPLMIGSVKTNIGHLEAAAGIASLIKVVLAMQHREIPPHLHLNELNPHISLQDMVATIPTKPTVWGVDGQQRLASISSFGFSGTNAHMVLEGKDAMSGDVTYNVSTFILTLSAKTENALEKIKQNYLQFLDEYPRATLADICFTANVGRKHFNYRLALVADSVESLYQKLQTADIKESKLNLNKKIVFVFTDDGFRYLDIGRQLYENQPIFCKALDRCNEILEPYLEKSLLEILDDDKYLVIHHKIKPLILFALEYALAQLWLSWGIEPVAIIGEGVGEYVAACIAGVFSLENGLKLIIQREQLTQEKNSNNKIITTEIKLSQANINIIDNKTGKFLETETATQADYWHNPVREKINFEASCSFLKQEGYQLFVEIGNNPILKEQAQQYLPPEDIDNWLTSVSDNQEYWRVLIQNLATLYEKGVEINWDGFYQDNSYNRLQLPTYPFEKQPYWIDKPKYQPRKIANQQSHPLLGEKLNSPLSQIQFESLLNIDTLPLVKDHRLGGIPVMNLVVYLEMAFASAATIFDSKFDTKNFILTDVIVPTALTFPHKETRTVQLIFNSEDSQTSYFQIFSQGEEKNQNDWTLNAGGKLHLTSTETFQSSSKTVSLRDIKERCDEEISNADFYQTMALRGATLGSECQMLEQIWRRDGEALGKVKYPKQRGLKEDNLYYLPLGEIDACLQILSATCSLDNAYSYLIVGFENFQFYANSNEQLWCHARLEGNNFAGDAQTIIGNVCLFDANGLVLAKFTNVQLKRVSYESLQLNSQTNGKLQYQPSLLSREKLLATPVSKQQEILEIYLLQCLSKSLQLSPEKIKVQQFLSHYLDSLMSFELKSRIETDLQIQVPIEKFFGDTNITQLAEFLLEQLTLANLISEPSPAQQSEDMEEITL